MQFPVFVPPQLHLSEKEDRERRVKNRWKLLLYIVIGYIFSCVSCSIFAVMAVVAGAEPPDNIWAIYWPAYLFIDGLKFIASFFS